jgi:hypothetical protein
MFVAAFVAPRCEIRAACAAWGSPWLSADRGGCGRAFIGPRHAVRERVYSALVVVLVVGGSRAQRRKRSRAATGGDRLSASCSGRRACGPSCSGWSRSRVPATYFGVAEGRWSPRRGRRSWLYDVAHHQVAMAPSMPAWRAHPRVAPWSSFLLGSSGFCSRTLTSMGAGWEALAGGRRWPFGWQWLQ